jgi:hypothetical protein
MKTGWLLKLAGILTAGFLSVSCGASLTLVQMEKKVAPDYPLEMAGKSIAVFSTINDRDDSTINVQVSKAVAKSFETRLSLPEGSIPVYNHFPSDSAAFDPDYIRALSLQSGADLLIMLKSVWAEEPVINQGVKSQSSLGPHYVMLPLRCEISAYDGITAEEFASFTKKDSLVLIEVLSRNDLRRARLMTLLYQALIDSSGEIGDNIAGEFFETWQPVERYLYFFSNQEWIFALESAKKFRWRDASEIWMRKAGSSDLLTSACAAFNMALVCEISGDKQLALEWLKFSEGRYPLKAIEGYKEYLKK